MTYYITALTIGILGSLHCIGMCGPIALVLPLGNRKGIERIAGAAIYNAGRVFTYAALGALFGIFGKLIFVAGIQQVLSVAVGAIILIYLIIPPSFFQLKSPPLLMRLYIKVRNKLLFLFKQKGNGTLFSIGILNGLLPCGLVYTALAGASLGSSPVKGALFMATFGLATTPFMFFVPYFKNKISSPATKVIRRTIPYLTACMAVLFILRGLNLGVPYLSPKTNSETKALSSCCAKDHCEAK